MNERLQKLLSPKMVAIVTVLWAVLGSVVVVLADANFAMWYREKLRGDLFNGSLTMAGFLVTVATFVVITMKEKVYDHPSYRQAVELSLQLSTKPERNALYAPLRRLTMLLALATSACLLCTLAHVSLVFLPTRWPVAACVSIAAATLSLTSFAILAAYGNFVHWLQQAPTFPAKQ